MALPGMIGFGVRTALTPVVWNSLDKTASVTLSNGDRTAQATAANQGVRGNIGKASGKWYFEIVNGPTTRWSGTGTAYIFGIATASFVTLGSTGVGLASGSAGVENRVDNYQLNGGGAVAANPDPGSGATLDSVFMFAVDLGAGNMWIGVNGTWGGVGGVVGDPAAGTAPSLSGLSGTYFPCASLSPGGGGNNGFATLNASATQCTYAAPSGFSYWGS